MRLEICKDCGSGDIGYESISNRFHCKECHHSAPSSPSQGRTVAILKWNKCNDSNTVTVAEVIAENEALKADLTKTIIQVGEVLKHHTMQMAQIHQLNSTLSDIAFSERVRSWEHAEEMAEAALKQSPEQSLNLIEAGAVYKAVRICKESLSSDSVDALIKHAEALGAQ